MRREIRLEELGPIEARAVRLLRLWCDSGAEAVAARLTPDLDPGPARAAAGALDALAAESFQHVAAEGVDGGIREGGIGDDARIALVGQGGTERRGHGNPALAIDLVHERGQERRHSVTPASFVLTRPGSTRRAPHPLRSLCLVLYGTKWFIMGFNGMSMGSAIKPNEKICLQKSKNRRVNRFQYRQGLV